MKVSWKDLLKIGAGVFLLYLAIAYWGKVARLGIAVVQAASPIIIGGVVAYLVNILMSRYERWYFPKATDPIVTKSRRAVCMLLAFCTLIASVVLVVWLILPQLLDCIGIIVAGMPTFIEAAVAKAIAAFQKMDLAVVPPEVIQTLESVDWQSKIGELVEVLTTGIGDVVDLLVNAISSVVSGVFTGIMSLIFAIYLLASKETLVAQFRRLARRYLPEKVNSKLKYVLRITNDCFRRYIVGQCTEAVILGVLCSLGMWIFRMPYAGMVGTLVGFTALVPIAGAYIGAGVGAFMILTVDPFKALMFIVFIVVLQQLEGNLIYPRVVGSSIGLPGIWVLAAVAIGGGIMGVGGMLWGVPLAAVIYRIVVDDVVAREAAELADAADISGPEGSTE